MSLSGEALPWARVEQHRFPPPLSVLPHAQGPAKPSQIPEEVALVAALPYFTDEEREARHSETLYLNSPELQCPGPAFSALPHLVQPRSPC